MKKEAQSTMQSEIFIVLMIVTILLFLIVSITLTSIKKEKVELEKEREVFITLKKGLEENITKLEGKEKELFIAMKTLENKVKEYEGMNATLNKNIRDILNKYTNLKNNNENINTFIDFLQKENKKNREKYEKENAEARKRYEEAKKHQQPPLITLDDAQGYRFNLSRATLSIEFQNKIKQSIATKILNQAKRYNCDTVEIYGYTDGLPFSKNHNSKYFDKLLHKCLTHNCNIDKIKSSSNLELGMQRAIAVVNYLKPYLIKKNSPIKNILPYSGGQFINEKGDISSLKDTKSNTHRRRIEIRLSRSKELRKK